MDEFKKFLVSQTGKAVVTIVLVIIIFGILIWALQSGTTAVTLITFIVCAYFGWKALNRITPNIFLWMSFTGWAVYFLIKGLLSIFIGAFVAPFQIAKMISNAINNSLEE